MLNTNMRIEEEEGNIGSYKKTINKIRQYEKGFF